MNEYLVQNHLVRKHDQRETTRINFFFFTISNIFQVLFILMFVKLQIQKKIHDFIKDGKLEKFKFEPMDKGWRAIV